MEACPYDALFMGSGFEEGQYKRTDLVISIDRLRQADKHPSTWFRPQLEGMEYKPGSAVRWDGAKWDGKLAVAPARESGDAPDRRQHELPERRGRKLDVV